jgi:hypothetical protein
MRNRLLELAILAMLVLVVLATLSPFDFEEPRRMREARLGPPTWVDDGLEFQNSGMLVSPMPTDTLLAAIREHRAFSVFLEIRTATIDQRAPRRILSFGLHKRHQAFIVGQEEDALAVRVLDPDPPRGVFPVREYPFRPGLEVDRWHRFLVACSDHALVVWRDGQRIGRVEHPPFDPDRWRRDLTLVVGNEADGIRGWTGTLRRLTVSAGAPSGDILREAGVDRESFFAESRIPDGRDLLDIHDNQGAAEWTAVVGDAKGREASDPWSLVPFSEPASRAWAREDWVKNFLFFMPLGFLFRRRGVSWLVAGLLALAVSASVEVAQVFLPTRHAQMTDVFLNTLGAWVGALAGGDPTRHG